MDEQENLLSSSGEKNPPPPTPTEVAKKAKEEEEAKEAIAILPNMLGSKTNPIIYKHHTFIDANIIITWNIHVKFIDCTFIKCLFNGSYTMHNCQFKDHDDKAFKEHTLKIEPIMNGYLRIYGNIDNKPKKQKYYQYIKKYYSKA